MTKNPTNPLSSDERTARLWQPKTPRRLNTEDYRQIQENLTGFFEILREWSVKEKKNDDNL